MRAYVTSDQKIQSLFSLHCLYCKYLKFCRLFIHFGVSFCEAH
uniref:Uncharacterized protein n=1 Tax=Anguilla anguilla TaxID=7936 RepID=A0A0E9STF5_ANGAN